MKKGLKAKSGLVRVSVGDRVWAYFPTNSRERKDRTATVFEVRQRYGSNNGQTRVAPLLRVLYDGESHLEYFDQSYVVEVLEHSQGPARPQENVFRGFKAKSLYFKIEKQGIWTGTIESLIIHVLGRHHGRFTHPLNDERRLKKLFNQQRAGFVDCHYGIYTVKGKQFARWVRQNAYSFFATTAELDAAGTDKIRRDDAIMEADLDYLDSMESDDRQGSQEPEHVEY